MHIKFEIQNFLIQSQYLLFQMTNIDINADIYISLKRHLQLNKNE